MRQRVSGVLLHPTSLPGTGPGGALGPQARAFVDWLHRGAQRVWQILPLGPVGLGNSPYASPSAFAGDPRLISLQAMALEGLLDSAESDTPHDSLRFDSELDRATLLEASWARFRNRAPGEILAAFEAFVESPEQESWLGDWALYCALKQRHGGASWLDWPPMLKLRDPGALRRASEELAARISYHKYLQFLFARQWTAIRRYARSRNIEILGDLPFYVALDSADVWSHRELFELREDGSPTHVAGVPPDYFSATGQLWGNPIYDWTRIADSGYRWWKRRINHELARVDRLRIDHFRAFSEFWKVPADHEDAIHGTWESGPGREFFSSVWDSPGELPFVAEDLGMISPDVHHLRRELGIPGMKVLQFGFSSHDSEHLPHNYTHDMVAYTGTHDNDTIVGWFAGLSPGERSRLSEYFGPFDEEIHWRMIRAVFSSEAQLAIVPIQDILGLGSEARMNLPGRAEGNWTWRLGAAPLSSVDAERLRKLTEDSRRAGKASESGNRSEQADDAL